MTYNQYLVILWGSVKESFNTSKYAGLTYSGLIILATILASVANAGPTTWSGTLLATGISGSIGLMLSGIIGAFEGADYGSREDGAISIIGGLIAGGVTGAVTGATITVVSVGAVCSMITAIALVIA